MSKMSVFECFTLRMRISVLHDLGKLFIHPFHQGQDTAAHPERLLHANNTAISFSPFLVQSSKLHFIFNQINTNNAVYRNKTTLL